MRSPGAAREALCVEQRQQVRNGRRSRLRGEGKEGWTESVWAVTHLRDVDLQSE